MKGRKRKRLQDTLARRQDDVCVWFVLFFTSVPGIICMGQRRLWWYVAGSYFCTHRIHAITCTWGHDSGLRKSRMTQFQHVRGFRKQDEGFFQGLFFFSMNSRLTTPLISLFCRSLNSFLLDLFYSCLFSSPQDQHWPQKSWREN